MAEIFEGVYSAKDLRIGIIASRFNEFVTKAMMDGALNELQLAGAAENNLQVIWVPGAYEIPVAVQTLIDQYTLDAVIVLGCIIRGETSHYEHIAQTICDSIQRISIERRIPIGFGVLTVENMEQAINRAGGKQGNKGRDAARTAVQMAQLFRNLKSDSERNEALNEILSKEFQK